MSCVGGSGPRGTNGTLMPTTPATRSGAISASGHTTMAPQSCPTNTARSSPMSSSSASRSPVRCSMS